MACARFEAAVLYVTVGRSYASGVRPQATPLSWPNPSPNPEPGCLQAGPAPPSPARPRQLGLPGLGRLEPGRKPLQTMSPGSVGMDEPAGARRGAGLGPGPGPGRWSTRPALLCPAPAV